MGRVSWARAGAELASYPGTRLMLNGYVHYQEFMNS